MKTLRLALVGTGNVAESYMNEIRALKRQCVDIEVVLACGRDARHTQEFAQNHGIGRSSNRFEDALDSGIDGLVVLTPMPDHAQSVRRALSGGKHVFCEKTLAATAGEARALARLATENGMILVTPPATPLSPAFRRAFEHIQQGHLGRVHTARAIYGWAGPDWADWFYGEDAGPVRDLGIYALTTLTGLLGPVSSVSALALNAEPQRRISGNYTKTPLPDTFLLTLSFASGTIASLSTGFSFQKTRAGGIELFGTQGSLVFNGQDWNASGYDVWSNTEGCWRSYEIDTPWRWTDGLRDFCEAVIGKRETELNLDHAFHVLDIVDAAQRALQGRAAVTVSSVFTIVPKPPASGAIAPHRQHKSV